MGCGGYGRFGFVLAGLLLAGSGARGQICRFCNLAGAAAAAAGWKAEGVSFESGRQWTAAEPVSQFQAYLPQQITQHICRLLLAFLGLNETIPLGDLRGCHGD